MEERGISKAFGAVLRRLRERSGYSVTELADKGVSRAHLIAMEKGESDPSLSMLFRAGDTAGNSVHGLGP